MKPTSPSSSSTFSLLTSPLIRKIMVTTATVSLMMTTMMTPTVSAFPKGAPSYVCGNMVPLHPGREQVYDPATFPYRITVGGGGTGTTEVTPGSVVRVTVQGQKADDQLKGLLVTVLDSSDRSVTGLSAPEGVSLQLLNCTRSKVTVPFSGLTHTERLDRGSVTFSWRVPDQAAFGDIYRLRVTIVKNVYVYWVGINTTLTVTHPAQTTFPQPTQTTLIHSPEMTSLSTGTTSQLPTWPETPSGGMSRVSGSLVQQARLRFPFAFARFGIPSRSNLVMGAQGFYGGRRTNLGFVPRWGYGGQGYGWNSPGMSPWVAAWYGR